MFILIINLLNVVACNILLLYVVSIKNRNYCRKDYSKRKIDIILKSVGSIYPQISNNIKIYPKLILSVSLWPLVETGSVPALGRGETKPPAAGFTTTGNLGVVKTTAGSATRGVPGTVGSRFWMVISGSTMGGTGVVSPLRNFSSFSTHASWYLWEGKMDKYRFFRLWPNSPTSCNQIYMGQLGRWDSWDCWNSWDCRWDC